MYRVVGSKEVSLASVYSDVDADLALEHRQRLDTEVCDGDEDTDDGDDGEHSGRRRTRRLVAQQPHRSLPCRPRQNLALV